MCPPFYVQNSKLPERIQHLLKTCWLRSPPEALVKWIKDGDKMIKCYKIKFG